MISEKLAAECQMNGTYCWSPWLMICLVLPASKPISCKAFSSSAGTCFCRSSLKLPGCISPCHSSPFEILALLL